MANTTNFNWETPDDTDLVKDGASAIRTLGSAIDTSLVDLKGGTTGQYLKKNSNTDLDYVWGNVSAVDNWTLLNSGGTSLSGSQTVTVSGISGQDKIMVLISGASLTSGSDTFGIRLNTDTGSNYYMYGSEISFPTSYAATNLDAVNGAGSYIYMAKSSSNSSSAVSGYLLITGCNSSGVKVFSGAGSATPAAGTTARTYSLGGYYNSASTISSVSYYTSSSTFDAGTMYIYASA